MRCKYYTQVLKKVSATIQKVSAIINPTHHQLLEVEEEEDDDDEERV